jgi:hypothetical protein
MPVWRRIISSTSTVSHTFRMNDVRIFVPRKTLHSTRSIEKQTFLIQNGGDERLSRLLHHLRRDRVIDTNGGDTTSPCVSGRRENHDFSQTGRCKGLVSAASTHRSAAMNHSFTVSS